ncbi:carbohydrate binding protein with CBM9 domain [Cellulophaga sp. RHA_52]|uniref:carbohydrate-binding family 9-like protein n=1 Tax=Cellulophaga sp. RHA_52 TaxID=1250036 RepID=UPI0011998F11|nr:carbohydrate-binding family 9-like protein [Cellulophaga sp. RHA_52]TVZ10515.1 carbohydrate binding protein with CBM9 domain [Cellulophaga sp. RHA_52]
MNIEPSIKIKRIIAIFLFLTYLCCASLLAQNTPKKYIAHKALNSLEIDGLANEESWENAKWTTEFIDIEGDKKATYKTRVKMLWDDTYLYFFALLDEPHVWGDITKRDAVIFHNNDFEIFIDPPGTTHNYMELEINALNTVWDLLLTKTYSQGGAAINNWDINGLKTAVHINGTLNNANDTDKSWSTEIAIPWKSLFEPSKIAEIPVNNFWRINFSRVQWQHSLIDGKYVKKKDANGKALPEYNWVWSPQGVINMHKPNTWGYVYFSDKTKENINWSIPKDEHIKWYLYKVFLNYVENNNEKEIQDKSILGTLVSPKLEKHKTGFNIWVKSPFTNKILVIKEDGKFNSNEAE